MINDSDALRDLVRLAVLASGRLLATGDVSEPYRLLVGDGQVVDAAAAYFAELQASGCRPTTLRSYENDLLRWCTARTLLVYADALGPTREWKALMDEFNEYLDVVAEVRRRYPGQREGQAYVNAARMMWPGLFDDIPSECDPFTLDRRLPAFLDWLPHAHAARRTCSENQSL